MVSKAYGVIHCKRAHCILSNLVVYVPWKIVSKANGGIRFHGDNQWIQYGVDASTRTEFPAARYTHRQGKRSLAIPFESWFAHVYVYLAMLIVVYLSLRICKPPGNFLLIFLSTFRPIRSLWRDFFFGTNFWNYKRFCRIGQNICANRTRINKNS